MNKILLLVILLVGVVFAFGIGAQEVDDQIIASCVSGVISSGYCTTSQKCTENYLRDTLISHYCGAINPLLKNIVVDLIRSSGGLIVSGGGGQSQVLPSGATPILGLKNPLGEGATFETLLNKIINFLFWVGMAVAPVMFIAAGFLYVTSAGNPQKVEQAKKMMIYAVIGLAVLLLAKGLVEVLKSIIGVNPVK